MSQDDIELYLAIALGLAIACYILILQEKGRRSKLEARVRRLERAAKKKA